MTAILIPGQAVIPPPEPLPPPPEGFAYVLDGPSDTDYVVQGDAYVIQEI